MSVTVEKLKELLKEAEHEKRKNLVRGTNAEYRSSCSRVRDLATAIRVLEREGL